MVLIVSILRRVGSIHSVDQTKHLETQLESSLTITSKSNSNLIFCIHLYPTLEHFSSLLPGYNCI